MAASSVVTIPCEVNAQVRALASHRSQVAGRRVTIKSIVVAAIHDYVKTQSTTPEAEILTLAHPEPV